MAPRAVRAKPCCGTLKRGQSTNMTSASSFKLLWRHGVFALAVLGPLAVLLFMARIPQDLAYHAFADRRMLLGIPNFANVASSVPFVFAGMAGLWVCLSRPNVGDGPGWLVLYSGITLVGAGSAYYHWAPDNGTLVWDRLPLALISAGLVIALAGEWISRRLAWVLLIPVIVAGLGSVIYWHYYNDLRWYVWIQLLPLVMIPVVMVGYRAQFSHQRYLLIALALYVLARISEVYDKEIFTVTSHLVSGHTLKHLLAALAACVVVAMLTLRTRIFSGDPPN